MRETFADIPGSSVAVPHPVPAGIVNEDSPLLPGALSSTTPSEQETCYQACCRRFWDLLVLLTPSSYTDMLLVFVPLGIASGVLEKSPQLAFWLNFLAILPLSKLNIRKVARLSAKLGPLGGGLLHAVLDNAILLIVGMTMMRKQHMLTRGRWE